MRENRIKGYYQGGGLPYGYKVVNKKILIDEEKAEVVIETLVSSDTVMNVLTDEATKVNGGQNSEIKNYIDNSISFTYYNTFTKYIVINSFFVCLKSIDN